MRYFILKLFVVRIGVVALKYKLMTHSCIDIKCGYTETDHKNPDLRKCPRCRNYMNSKNGEVDDRDGM